LDLIFHNDDPVLIFEIFAPAMLAVDCKTVGGVPTVDGLPGV